VGDIGGTNCRLVLWKIYPGLRDEILFSKVCTTLAGAYLTELTGLHRSRPRDLLPSLVQWDDICCISLRHPAADQSAIAQVYPTKDYATFEDALDEFYAEPVVGRDPPQSAALAVAGPVVDNRCKMTNLSWLIDGHDLSRRRGVLCAAVHIKTTSIPTHPSRMCVALHGQCGR